MFTKKTLLLAAWTAAVMAYPALGYFTPIVRPVIDHAPIRADNAWRPRMTGYPVEPRRYDDGVSCPGAMVVMEEGQRLMRQPCYTSYEPICQPGPACSRPVEFWRRGPVRRTVSAPFRWIFCRGR